MYLANEIIIMSRQEAGRLLMLINCLAEELVEGVPTSGSQPAPTKQSTFLKRNEVAEEINATEAVRNLTRMVHSTP